MKSIWLSFVFFLTLFKLFSQAPQRLSYQAIVRNSSNNLVVSTQIGMRISILQASINGTPVYSERHVVTSNENGLIAIEIGGGTVLSGVFSTIQWSTGSYFIKTETDPSGGTNYSITGTSQLLSVPYALFANSAGNGLQPGTQAGQIMFWDGTKWTNLPKGSNGQYLKWCNDSLTWGPCLPQVKTKEVHYIDVNGAALAFEILTDGGAYIIECGSLISTSPNLTIPNNGELLFANNQIGFFELSLMNLQPQTIYYVRPFARNSVGITYGNELSFTTLAQPKPPAIQTNAVTSITTTSATSGGNISDSGTTGVAQKGIVWHTSSGPTVDNNIGKTNEGSGSGNFTATMGNLLPGTTYYVRAYASNSIGTTYGNEVVFTTTTPPPPTASTDIDGNVYPVIKISTKYWLSKNLNVTRYRNGDIIPQVQDSLVWSSLKTGAWCYYENKTENGTVYGKLYNWYAVNDSRGLAPEGWHIPTNEEWGKLIDTLGGGSIAGGKMKATTLWDSPNTAATNSSGFNGLPGGVRGNFGMLEGVFYNKGKWGNWWTSTISGEFTGFYINLSSDFESTNGPSQFEKNYGYSIRCIWNY